MENTPIMPDELPSSWRARAHYLREYSDSNTARLWELATKELQAALAAHGRETLTLVQAAKLSGFTARSSVGLDQEGTDTECRS